MAVRTMAATTCQTQCFVPQRRAMREVGIEMLQCERENCRSRSISGPVPTDTRVVPSLPSIFPPRWARQLKHVVGFKNVWPAKTRSERKAHVTPEVFGPRLEYVELWRHR